VEIILLVVGPTHVDYAQKGLADFSKRIGHYAKFRVEAVKDRAAQHAALKSGDLLVLLDERGQHLTSMEFSQRLQKWMNAGPKRLVFAVGDAWGFDAEFRSMAQYELALSKMTFPHDLVRVLFAEQLYRGLTILRGEPYHHEG
jgi:23S rRNA (pseudouridine1915-N3)-methyltransferase